VHFIQAHVVIHKPKIASLKYYPSECLLPFLFDFRQSFPSWDVSGRQEFLSWPGQSFFCSPPRLLWNGYHRCLTSEIKGQLFSHLSGPHSRPVSSLSYPDFLIILFISVSVSSSSTCYWASPAFLLLHKVLFLWPYAFTLLCATQYQAYYLQLPPP
jgi:hypothetical protein